MSVFFVLPFKDQLFSQSSRQNKVHDCKVQMFAPSKPSKNVIQQNYLKGDWEYR